MQRMQYSKERRDEALRLLAAHGKAEAARLTGIPEGTIASWGARNGVASPPASDRQPQLVAAAATLVERKQALADDMLTRARSMIGQLDVAHVEKKALVVSGDKTGSRVIEIAEVDYDRPPTGAQKQIVETVEILIRNVQLLTGAATQNLATTITSPGTVAAVKERATAVLDELSERRAS